MLIVYNSDVYIQIQFCNYSVRVVDTTLDTKLFLYAIFFLTFLSMLNLRPQLVRKSFSKGCRRPLAVCRTPVARRPHPRRPHQSDCRPRRITTTTSYRRRPPPGPGPFHRRPLRHHPSMVVEVQRHRLTTRSVAAAVATAWWVRSRTRFSGPACCRRRSTDNHWSCP